MTENSEIIQPNGITITKEILQRVCNNARLRLTEQEQATFLADTQEVLKAFRTLNEADVAKIQPAFQPIPLPTFLREDLPIPSLKQEIALANATAINGYIKGPRAI